MEERKILKKLEMPDIRKSEELDRIFLLADNIVTKNYLSVLERYHPCETAREFDETAVYEHASLFRVKKMVYDRDENNLQKLVNTYASAAGLGSNLAMVIHSNGKNVELYLGTMGADEISSARVASEALCGNLIGNFPGSLDDYNDIVLDNRPLQALMDNCTKELYSGVSVVSGIGSTRTEEDAENENYIQGIEKMIDTMRGIPFSAVFIADVIQRERLQEIKAEYEMLYSKLIPFLKSELSFQESSAEGISKTLSESLSKTLTSSRSSALGIGTTENSAHTQGHSVTHTDGTTASHTSGRSQGISTGTTKGESRSNSFGGSINAGGSVGIPGICSVNGGVSVNASHSAGTSAAKSESQSRGFQSSNTLGNSHSIARTKNFSDTISFGTTKSQTNTIGDSEAKGEIKSIADGTSKTETTGRSLSITYMNKTIQQLLDKIDEQLERMKESENYGVFASAAYFFATTPMQAKMAASSYKSLINGNCTHVENANINSWQDAYSVNVIKKYVRKLRHPMFVFDDANMVTPASIVSGRELAVQMGMPQSSVSGVSVIETAAFGRNVETDRRAHHRFIRLGSLYHMGRDEESAEGKIPVRLDLESLTMHMFITGSTGSGKSNAIYSLLEKVLEKGEEQEKIPFMVIEPAKGEYKDQFGNRKDVRVFGTNAKKTELLRLNPFCFPEEVHVLEHIDRLIEIFNVCWPMYAAMPAVLKDAVERAYMNAGWDLNESECRYKNHVGIPLYPGFHDILQQVHLVMDESGYSADSRGDYIGALCTRIKSLTNGLYGQIFTPDELSMQELYDENVIVDLSRVGSIETKALIMGLLILKMQEYRMAQHHDNNARLKHLTILEEAHNLLKRISQDQSSDSSNLLGKSVEMLANSIAEMRTYGEGFVIADQAPGLLDMAVIRNTNTKIILRLPDMSDRELAGRAAALNDNQILELSKLKTGVAAVYQNDWLEPVLCHVDKADGGAEKYAYTASPDKDISRMSELINYIMLPAPDKLEVKRDVLARLEEMVYKLQITSDAKIHVVRYLKETNVEKIQKLRNKLIYSLFNSKSALLLSNAERHDMYAWRQMMLDKLEPALSSFGAVEQDKILSIIANEQAEREHTPESIELFHGWMKYLKIKGDRDGRISF